MRVQNQNIDDDQFTNFLRQMPQVSVELFIERNGKILLAQRQSEPAKGEWFVPGSRLHKGETFEQAVNRVANQELSIEVEIIEQLGVYNHFWKSSAFPSVEETHTVNVVYHVQTPEGEVVQLDDQHGDYKYTDGTDIELHPYVRQYLLDSRINSSL